MLIHGAIIARELGIPCVNGMTNAVDLLCDGDSVTVDGCLGIVTLGEPELHLELGVTKISAPKKRIDKQDSRPAFCFSDSNICRRGLPEKMIVMKSCLSAGTVFAVAAEPPQPAGRPAPDRHPFLWNQSSNRD